MDRKEVCNMCNGTGICNSCKGQGKIGGDRICEMCDGTGICLCQHGEQISTQPRVASSLEPSSSIMEARSTPIIANRIDASIRSEGTREVTTTVEDTSIPMNESISRAREVASKERNIGNLIASLIGKGIVVGATIYFYYVAKYVFLKSVRAQFAFPVIIMLLGILIAAAAYQQGRTRKGILQAAAAIEILGMYILWMEIADMAITIPGFVVIAIGAFIFMFH